ncbi:hypothetical protein MFFC18_30430 [Mariniblastus fucicola]|uniref:Uncharacterized protein n=1 Tax=Mariniblastus fucicola TaxID=980251 RepID=A0A5B9P9Y0_9BACT|nr:hypothetical protein MFFC18_30430 [Mariniblastus fucicola]
MSSMSTDLRESQSADLRKSRSAARKSKSEKHCRSCFRSDIHVPVKFPAFVHGFLTVMSFGLFLVVKPTRCVCCGTKRIF